ncbi:hypothetical protein [Paenibacillus illinoisensis]|uniref:Uncharacterized protein n=1 Tax=Paenibacillus illinoisensis TaxID=59845 RepID=A0A2W0C8I4_9BACL|nr:hypothetical protein [Paenibacillus illinoisensis]PYY28314.1 hypothetical protein PIL02S_03465 [Paenibacillus illinoisensis]
MKKLYPTLGVLCLLYPVMAMVLYIAHSQTPNEIDYSGVKIDNSLNDWLMTTIYDNLVNGGAVALFVAASAACFYMSFRNRYQY